MASRLCLIEVIVFVLLGYIGWCSKSLLTPCEVFMPKWNVTHTLPYSFPFTIYMYLYPPFMFSPITLPSYHSAKTNQKDPIHINCLPLTVSNTTFQLLLHGATFSINKTLNLKSDFHQSHHKPPRKVGSPREITFFLSVHDMTKVSQQCQYEHGSI